MIFEFIAQLIQACDVFFNTRLHERFHVATNRWTTDFSEQPKQAPSPLAKLR
jgi:hypothetical protein